MGKASTNGASPRDSHERRRGSGIGGGVDSDWREEEQAGECGEAEVPPAHHNEEAIQLVSLGGP